MSENESHHHGKNEIIIIKRHGHGDHGHHGGAWKIAYADFMTAMMAFFLVMWLVNAANDATKAAVASYFNPIKLTDSSPADKGIAKPGKQAQGEATQEKSKEDGEEKSQGSAADSGQEKSATAGEKTTYSEADYFENPYAVLSEIVLEVGQQANVSVKGEGGAAAAGPATGADGGDAYKDPFDPDFWTKQVQVNSKMGKGQDAGKAGKEQAAAAVAAQDRGNENGKGGIPGDQQTAEKGKGGSAADKNANEQGGATAEPKPGQAQDKASEVASAQNEMSKAESQAAAKAAADLKKEIMNTLPASVGKLADAIRVEPSEGGLLISVSDQVSTPMFTVGSAVPSRELVLAMQDIGKVLAKSKGSVVIRGHTDGRPYKDGTGDNWGLSLNRARSAYYMLVSGGLSEKRINHVSGYADRFLKVPSDPYSPANRRIEILLEGKTVAGG